jgi:SAM-dependent methyltransferase/uncharacterized protein YbaR (Trm112 family)
MEPTLVDPGPHDEYRGWVSSLLDVLRCPTCHHALTAEGDTLVCAQCAARYPSVAGLPSLVPESSPLRRSLDAEAAARPSRVATGTDANRQADYWETDTWYREVDHPIVAGFSQQRWQHLASRLPLSELRSALDVGAGNGFSTRYAPAHLDIVATDGSARMLTRHPGEKRVLADATALPFDDGSFDLVYCWELLHHVDEPWRALAEMRRVSSRYVVFFEPNPWNVAQAGFALADPEHRWVLRFRQRYTRDQAERAGLRVLTYERCGLIFPNKTPAPLYALLKHLPYRVPFVGISQLVIAESR